jgi:hypothetical protein
MIDLEPYALHHFLIAHIWLIYPLGQVYAEPVEQAQVEDLTNLALDQGKPRCI